VFESMTGDKPELANTVVFMLVVWCILLVLGALPALMLTGMAFEGGHTLDAYLSLTAVWSYPPLVAIAFLCRRKKPVLIWIPSLTILLLVVEQVAWQFGLRVKFSN
jgi:hypothetical protein